MDGAPSPATFRIPASSRPGWITVLGFATFCVFLALVPTTYRLAGVEVRASPLRYFEGLTADEVDVRSGVRDVALWIEHPGPLDSSTYALYQRLSQDLASGVVAQDGAEPVTFTWSSDVTAYTREADGVELVGFGVGVTGQSVTSITIPEIPAHGFALGHVADPPPTDLLPLLWLVLGLPGLAVAILTLRPSPSELHHAKAEQVEEARQRAEMLRRGRERRDLDRANLEHAAKAGEARRANVILGDPGAPLDGLPPAPRAYTGGEGYFVLLMVGIIFGPAIWGGLAVFAPVFSGTAPVPSLLPIAGDTTWRFAVSIATLGIFAGGVPLSLAALVPRGRAQRFRTTLIVLAALLPVGVILLALWTGSMPVERLVP